jgi:hypothetical protein
MNNKRRLFSTLLCVAALTAGLFVSGCGSDKAGGIGSVVSSVVDNGGDEKAAAKLNTLIDATNRFNSENATWGQNYADGLAKLKGGFQEGAIRTQPHYDTLKEALEASKKEGSTFKEVDAERDALLAVLNELVPTYKDLLAYDDSKAYMNDGSAKGKELAAKYVAQVEKFDAAYAKFNEVLNKTNTEQTKKQIEKLKKEGKKGYAAAMESTLRLTTLVENLEQAPQKADKAAVEKELTEIQTLLKSINNDRGEVLVDNYNSVIGAVRQVLADPNENNLNGMIQYFNNYIETYNNTTPDQFDGK